MKGMFAVSAPVKMSLHDRLCTIKFLLSTGDIESAEHVLECLRKETRGVESFSEIVSLFYGDSGSPEDGLKNLITPDYLTEASDLKIITLIDHFNRTLVSIEELQRALRITRERKAALNSREYMMAGDLWEELHDGEKLLWNELAKRKEVKP